MIENAHLLESIDPALFATGDDVDARYEVDWSDLNPHRPAVVLKPRATDDVAAMLALCHDAGQAVVVQGGRTGLSGGATPKPGEWALSLERLTNVHAFDPDAMTVTVGAGVPLARVHELAASAGLRFPVDLGARGSCVAGGIVSTNAGGTGVIRYGMTRASVLGLVAVLADGRIIPAHNALLKNNAGYDLKHLFIGSEGTLGVVTEVTLRLVPEKRSRQTALLALDTYADVVALLKTLQGSLDGLAAFELMWSGYFQAAVAASGTANPFQGEYGYYVLVENETGATSDGVERFTSALMAVLEQGGVADAVVAKSGAEAAALWAIRDGIAEMLPRMVAPFSFDIGIPLAAIDGFRGAVEQRLASRFPGIEVHSFGHVGDGNVHVIASTGDAADEAEVAAIVYEEAGRYANSVSAEHGIGVLKRDWLSLSRSPAEIELMRLLKQTLDPKGILNPGRVI